MRTEHHNLGIASCTTAVFFFSIMDAVAKWLTESYPPIEIVWFRYVFGLIPALVLIGYGGGLRVLKTNRPLIHILRASLLFASLLLFFTGLRVLPLAEAIAILFTTPLFVAGLSKPLLNEPVGPRRRIAVVIGFIGVLVMMWPAGGAFRAAVLWPLTAALCVALAMLLTRRMAATEHSIAIFFYTNFGAGIASLPFAALRWHQPIIADLWLFLLIGVLGGTGAYLIVVAYRNAPAALIAPFEYTALVWGAIFGWVFWHEQPKAQAWVGAAIIVLASLYLARKRTVPVHGE